MDRDGETVLLRRRVELLEAENDALRRQLGQRVVLPRCLMLTPMEDRIVARLMVSDMATKDQLLDAVMDGRLDQDVPMKKIVDVCICKIRRKGAAWGIEIVTLWGRGYALSPAGRQRLQVLIGQERAA